MAEARETVIVARKVIVLPKDDDRRDSRRVKVIVAPKVIDRVMVNVALTVIGRAMANVAAKVIGRETVNAVPIRDRKVVRLAVTKKRSPVTSRSPRPIEEADSDSA